MARPISNLPSYLEERFWAKVDKSGTVPEHAPELGPCWVWTACRSHGGYGAFSVTRAIDSERLGGCPTRRPLGAHRVAKLLEREAPWPEGHSLQIDHLCRNRACVRPSHLEWVLPIVNNHRRPDIKTGFCRRGHELTPENLTNRADGKNRCKRCQAENANRYYHAGGAEKRRAKRVPYVRERGDNGRFIYRVTG